MSTASPVSERGETGGNQRRSERRGKESNSPSAALSRFSAPLAVKIHYRFTSDLTRPRIRPRLADVTMRMSSNGMGPTEQESPLYRWRRQKVDLAIFAQAHGFPPPSTSGNQGKSSQIKPKFRDESRPTTQKRSFAPFRGNRCSISAISTRFKPIQPSRCRQNHPLRSGMRFQGHPR